MSLFSYAVLLRGHMKNRISYASLLSSPHAKLPSSTPSIFSPLLSLFPLNTSNCSTFLSSSPSSPFISSPLLSSLSCSPHREGAGGGGRHYRRGGVWERAVPPVWIRLPSLSLHSSIIFPTPLPSPLSLRRLVPVTAIEGKGGERGLQRRWAWETAADLPHLDRAVEALPRPDPSAAALPCPDLASVMRG